MEKPKPRRFPTTDEYSDYHWQTTFETIKKFGLDKDVTIGEGDDMIITSKQKANELRRRPGWEKK